MQGTEMYVGSREGEAPEVRPAEVISAKPDQLLAIPQFIRFYDPVDKKTWIINMGQMGCWVIDATFGREKVSAQYGGMAFAWVGAAAQAIIRILGIEPDSVVKI